VRPPSEAEHLALIGLRDAGPAASRARAAAVLLSAAGVPVPGIMRRLRLSRLTVTHWLRRFEHAGVDGLADRARPGRASRISPEALRHIAMVVGARPRDLGIQGTRWSLARLKRYLVQTGTVPTLSLELLRITLKRLGLSLTASRAGQIQKGVTTMIPGAFEYHSPSSLGEATALLAKLGDDAKVLSGGQSLIPLMKLRLATPHHLVDINGLPGLAYVREDGGALRIGGLTREADLEESDVVRRRYPLLLEEGPDRDPALARGPDRHHLRAQGQHGRRVVVGGSPCARLPPTVAMLRTIGSAMTLHVSAESRGA